MEYHAIWHPLKGVDLGPWSSRRRLLDRVLRRLLGAPESRLILRSIAYSGLTMGSGSEAMVLSPSLPGSSAPGPPRASESMVVQLNICTLCNPYEGWI